MFDDIFCATALVGVLSVLAAVLASIASPPDPVSAAGTKVAVGKLPANAAGPGRSQSAAAMPVYELPRVVITGQRVRDGDVLADSSTPGRSRIPAELPDR